MMGHATSTGSRSTALSMPGWALGICLLLVAIIVLSNAPIWILSIAMAFFGVMLLTFIILVAYFAKNNPDAMRSERFKLTKMAIQRGIVGDSTQGIINEQKQKLVGEKLLEQVLLEAQPEDEK